MNPGSDVESLQFLSPVQAKKGKASSLQTSPNRDKNKKLSEKFNKKNKETDRDVEIDLIEEPSDEPPIPRTKGAI